MAIIRTDGTEEYKGTTLTNRYSLPGFAFSDYGIAYVADVWTGSEIKAVGVGVDEFGLDAVTPDASPEVVEAARAWKADQIARREAESLAWSLLNEWNAVRQGDAVVVFKGRKVAQGTRGVVRWLGQGTWGTRVGLAVEGQAALVYTAASNVKRDHSDDALAREIDAAHESAIWYAANVIAPKATLQATGITKGDKVTPKSGAYAGTSCRVIWTGTRGGQARVGVVPAKAPKSSRPEADWLPLDAVTSDAAVTFQGLRGRTL
jgi:hypothetical protein